MKISKIELFKVPPRWLFLKMTTDEGVTGWGEPVCEGKADTVAAAVRELGTQLIGRSAADVEDAFQQMYRTGFYRGGPILTSALSGIEQARSSSTRSTARGRTSRGPSGRSAAA